MKNGSEYMADRTIPSWEKYTMTVEEAGKYFRVGENKLRKIISENQDADFILWNGNRPQIKRKLFEKYIDEGYDIIYTGIGSSMSKSYENAVLMSNEFPEGRIEVVDSKNLSTGIGLVVLKACKWRKEGKNVHEIAELMRETIPHVRSQFVIDTMEYLHKGGRCSGMVRLVGTILKIKPIIEVREGKMEVGAKPRGKIEFGLDKLAEMLAADADNVDLDNVFITHSEADKSCEYLTEKVKEIVPEANVLSSRAGCVISTHCGPGTIGVLYILKH
jgi:DegV family protein with EDD domain